MQEKARAWCQRRWTCSLPFSRRCGFSEVRCSWSFQFVMLCMLMCFPMFTLSYRFCALFVHVWFHPLGEPSAAVAFFATSAWWAFRRWVIHVIDYCICLKMLRLRYLCGHVEIGASFQDYEVSSPLWTCLTSVNLCRDSEITIPVWTCSRFVWEARKFEITMRCLNEDFVCTTPLWTFSRLVMFVEEWEWGWVLRRPEPVRNMTAWSCTRPHVKTRGKECVPPLPLLAVVATMVVSLRTCHQLLYLSEDFEIKVPLWTCQD